MHKNNIFNIAIGERGEFRAEVHDGHTYDSEGRIITAGKVRCATAWGHNTITLGGFNALLNGNVNVVCVAGEGNTAPSESDSLLVSYLGKRSSAVVDSRNINLTADAEGYYQIETVIRSTFNPGALGSGTINIAEAGMAMSTNPNGATALLSRGLLVDPSGDPTTVSMDAATEYLDIYWKHTRFIPSEITGTQNIDILGVPTPHDYIIRPVLIDPNHDQHSIWWGVGSLQQIPGFAPTNAQSGFNGPSYGPYCFDGDISALTNSLPSGNALKPTSVTVDAYVPDSKTRTYSVNMAPADVNFNADLRSLTLRCTGSGWQVQIDPRIVKKATPARVLRLDFRMTMANK